MINLYHLKYFYDAALAKSLSEAAVKNRVSRSAISQAIRALEKALDVEILHHQKNSFKLTSEGELLVERCLGVFSLIGSIQDDISGAKTSISGSLSIAASHSISISVLPKFLIRFSKEFPKVKLSLFTGNSFQIRELLRTRQVELGVGLADTNFSEFSKTLLRKGRFALVSSRSKDRVGPGTTFVIGDRGDEVAVLRQGFQKRFGVPLPVQMEVQSWEVIAALASHGLGVGLIPDFMMSKDQKVLKQVKCDFALYPYELCAIHRSRGSLSKSSRLFLDGLAAHLSTLQVD